MFCHIEMRLLTPSGCRTRPAGSLVLGGTGHSVRTVPVPTPEPRQPDALHAARHCHALLRRGARCSISRAAVAEGGGRGGAETETLKSGLLGQAKVVNYRITHALTSSLLARSPVGFLHRVTPTPPAR